MSPTEIQEPDPLSGREYCPRCGSGPRQLADVEECPDCGYLWSGPPLLSVEPKTHTKNCNRFTPPTIKMYPGDVVYDPSRPCTCPARAGVPREQNER